jgi:hypothetical protein
MDAKYTTGDWVYESGSVYADRPIDEKGWRTSRVALMDRENPNTTPMERDANAKLIAAAPEMLRLLRGVVTRHSIDEHRTIKKFLDGLEGLGHE